MNAVAPFDEEYARLKSNWEKRREYQRTYRETHMEYFKIKQRERRQKLREEKEKGSMESRTL